MKEVIILIGFPGCGKSTFAKTLGKNYDILSSDTIRIEVYGDANAEDVNRVVFKKLHGRMWGALKNGKNVVIDATNLTYGARYSYINIAKKNNAKVVGILFDTPIDVCKERNSKRSRVVPDEAYVRLERKYVKPSMSEGFDEIRVVPV
jgi:predicted kinase